MRELGGALSYRQLAVILNNAPRDSAFGRAMLGEHADWTLTDHLLAIVIDHLAAANWQRGGGKSKRPKPIPRPGVHDPDARRFGTTVSLEEARRKWPRKKKES